MNCKTSLFSVLAFVVASSGCSALAGEVSPQATTAVTSSPPAVADTGPSPYQLKLQYAGEAWDNAGGYHNGTVYMQNVDAQLRVNTDKAFGWTGGKALFEGYYGSSRSLGNNYVGTNLDSPSPIDTYGNTRFSLYQAYYDQNFGDTDLLLGVWDPQSEFANTDAQNLFLNRSFTWNAALDLSGGSLLYAGNFPWTTVAFRARQALDDKWTIQGAVLNGMPGNPKDLGVNDYQFKGRFGAIGLAEINYVPKARTKFYVGYWGYTGKQTAYNQDRQIYGSDGGYIGGSTRFYTQEGKRGLDGFFNIGVADSIVNEVNRSLNVGVTYTGLFDARPNDKAGFAVNVNGASDPYRKDLTAQGGNPAMYETHYELTYHAKVNDWLKVQPDIQYISHPNLVTDLKNDFVFGVHFEIGHWFEL